MKSTNGALNAEPNPAEDVARNTHLLEWLGDGFTNCQHGSREWCEGYLHNALDVIAAQDAELFSLRRKVEEAEAAHPDDIAVDRFAAAMKAKLAAKRAEGRGGWEDPAQCTGEFLSELLRNHVEKGDPLDVGNFAMMLHQRGERIS